MPDTEASIGYGTVVEMAEVATPATRFYLGEVKTVTPPEESTETPDATHMKSRNRTREFVDGLTDPGNFSFDMNLVVGSPSDRYLIAAKGKRKVLYLTFPSGEQLVMTGVRSGYSKTIPLDDVMTATVTMKVSGDPTLTEVTAPRNVVVPTIAGVAKVGAPLSVDEGIWAGAVTIAYQWQADGVDIADATGSTFVPAVGNIGDVITCEVTASNSEFDVMAETAGTVAVVA